MCQLTALNIDDVLLTKLFSHFLAVINADKGNRDGFGCIVGNKSWKTIVQPTAGTLDHITLLKDMVKPESVLLHVRSASFGIKVTPDNVHPFRFSNLIGMHNGTLYFPDEYPSYSRNSEESRESDSKRFFELLNTNYKGNMVEALQVTMKDLTGKFAFLIKDLRTKKIYVVRGKTAQLHWTQFLDEENSVIGIAVNTDKLCLEKAINATGVIYNLLSARTLMFLSPVKEVPEESIFELVGHELVKVGELKENPVVYYQPARTESTKIAGQQPHFPITVNSGTVAAETDITLNTFVNYFRDTGMYLSDLDILSNAVFGKLFCDLDVDDFKILNAYVMPQLVLSHNVLKKITDSFGMMPTRADIVAAGLEFPLGVNSTQSMISKLKKYRKELHAKYAELEKQNSKKSLVV